MRGVAYMVVISWTLHICLVFVVFANLKGGGVFAESAGIVPVFFTRCLFMAARGQCVISSLRA